MSKFCLVDCETGLLGFAQHLKSEIQVSVELRQKIENMPGFINA